MAVSGTVTNCVNPIIGVDGSGTAKVVFQGNDGSDGIFYSQSTNGTTWSTPVKMPPYAGGSMGQGNPDMVLDKLGNPYITLSMNLLDYACYAPVYYNSTDGINFSLGVIDHSTGDALKPSLGFDQDNNAHAVWTANSSFDPTGYWTYYSKYTAGSGWSAPEKVKSDVNSGSGKIVVDTDGNPHVFFDTALYLKKTGDTWSTEVAVGTTSTSNIYGDIVLDASGMPHVVYWGSNGTNNHIYYSSDTKAAPVVTTTAATDITSTAATSGGNVTSDKGDPVTARGVCWSTSMYPTTADSKTTDGTGTGEYSSNITGLEPSTNYHVRAYATNGEGTTYGADLTFSTPVAPPTVTTQAATSVSTTGATLNGDITDNNGASSTARGFKYRKVGDSTWTAVWDPGDGHTPPFGTGAYSLAIASLDPDTTYEFYAIATNSAGDGTGATLQFVASLKPTVSTTAPTSVTTTTASSGGNVTSEGGTTITARGVCWSTSENPTTSDNKTTDGSGTGTYTSSITGLIPATLYHVRAYATNSAGTSYGDDLTLTTHYQVPTITSISPTSKTEGEAGFTLTVNGTNFVPGSVVKWNGSHKTTTYISPTQLTASIPASDIASDGTANVTVYNPAPGGGMSNAKTFTVNAEPEPEPPAPDNSPLSTWYLAEGTNAWGFSTQISIQNPNNSPVEVTVTLMPKGAANVTEKLTLPPNSQTTLTNDHLTERLGGQKDFSTKIEATDKSKAIAVDRTMEWTGEGASAPEGHASTGVTSPAKTWYLPEGSTSWGFETWLLIQNPNSSEASVDVTYMIEGSETKTVNHKVPANSRESFSMQNDVGTKDASIKVVSNLPVIPERAMYRNNKREGHDSIGTTSPANDFYLAEGAVGYDSGYITYVLVQNPQDSPNDVTITYFTGSGEVTGPTFQMPANSRKTVKVNDTLPSGTDVSTLVHGSKPVIAERAMYWNSAAGEACHDSVGMSTPATTFYFPDGETSNGRETYTLVQNPNSTDVKVTVTYLTPTGAGNVTKNETIPGNSRKTFNMSSHSSINGRAAIMVESDTSGKKIMCERAMYWSSRSAGTDTIGGCSD